MGLLAFACVGLGLLPGLAGKLLASVAGPELAWTSPGLLAVPGALVAPLPLLATLTLTAIAFAALVRFFGGQVGTRRTPTWVCGFALQPRMSYGSTAFAKPIRLFFQAIVRPERVVEADYALEPYFPTRLSTHGSIQPVFERHLYGPLARGLLSVARSARVLQGGNIRLYLAYILATLVVLLLIAR
jgi:hydrogenase-4 component B